MSNQSPLLLVVDDNEMNRDLLSRRLQKFNYRVMGAADGHQALDLLAKEPIDLVLLDVEMPVMSGLEVLSMIRQTNSANQLPVIMVTAKTDTDDIVSAFELGANDYIAKPIDLQATLARVKAHLTIKQAQEALRESEERYTLAVQGANDGIWDWNLKSNEIYFSPRWRVMLGLNENDQAGKPDEWFKRVHPEDYAAFKTALDGHLAGDTDHLEVEHRMLHEDGDYRWMRTRGLAVRDHDHKPTRLAGSQTDITEAKVFDTLTGLPNRNLFLDQLERCLLRRKRKKNYLFALLLLDLDRFKLINESLGRSAGDALLIAVAKRLETCLRQTDMVSRCQGGHGVARLGGNEFTILLEDLHKIEDASRVAQRIINELAAPFQIAQQTVYITCSIGVSINTGAYSYGEDIFRDADTAMNRAKVMGRNRYEIFDQEMRDQSISRIKLEADLRAAIDGNHLQLYYQPIVCLKTGDLYGFEALLRWFHPERGHIPPSEFIPIAEETELIHSLTHWILSEACRQMRFWQIKYPSRHPWVISVNISGRQFNNTELSRQVENILEHSGLDSHDLTLELTENIIMEDVSSTLNTLLSLKALGLRLSIDDFGTGYSSLSYLHSFPIDTLKVDRSFINQMKPSGENLEITRTIISLARSLKMDTVAEGVETAEQLSLLHSLGCKYAQGFYFAKPLEPAKAELILAANETPWQLQDTLAGQK